MDVAARVRVPLRAAAALALAGLAFHALHSGLGLGGRALDDFTNNWLYDSLVLGAALACIVRAALVQTDRAAWLLIGAALSCNAAAEIYYSLAFGEGDAPVPSPADALYLAYYPCVYVGLVLLVRRRFEHFAASTWMDGAIAAAATAAIVAAFAVAPIVRASNGSAISVATELAYPVGDLLLLSIVAAVFALSRWRPGRAWALLGAALVVGGIADTIFAYQNATGSYAVGTLLDSLWPASALAIGFAAWQRPADPRRVTLEGMRMLVVPGLFAAMALGLLIYGGIARIAPAAMALAGAAMLLVIARATWTFSENLKLLEGFKRDAVTDPLTGLGNRRRLTTDLERAVAAASPERPFALAIFDLNGFKRYNDTFGHLAGDELLTHLGGNLARAVSPRGIPYRLGGDEFCLLAQTDANEARPLISAACTALSSTGEGFRIDTAVGQAIIPFEASTPSMALRLADDRMYAHKGSERVTTSAREQAHNVLRSMLREREPELHEHLTAVARLAAAVGNRLGMRGEQLDELVRAADLYDVGKSAIPDEILRKPGPLNDREWSFVHRHPIIGERILGAAPALGPVAALVRSSYERWDGSGYPDGLEGQAIPLGARVIRVCDAYCAITSERAHEPAIGEEEALARIRERAGADFDPAVVEAFLAECSSARGEAAADPRAAGTPR
jgi:diguanylate cyclase (GGDEF)-like protein